MRFHLDFEPLEGRVGDAPQLGQAFVVVDQRLNLVGERIGHPLLILEYVTARGEADLVFFLLPIQAVFGQPPCQPRMTVALS